jgi:hypothetical protein
MVRRMAAVVAAASALVCASSQTAWAGALRSPSVHTAGTRFVDRAGHRVTLRGYNVNGGTDAVPLRRGANFVRIPVEWAQIQPRRKRTWNASYLRALDRQVRFYGRHHMIVLLDIHVVRQSPYFGGIGVPSWYYADGRFPATSAGATRAEVAWWTREAARSHAAFLPFVRMLVSRYRSFPNVLGYEIWNEPQSNATSIPLHRQTQAILNWQAPVARTMRRLDPLRAVVFQTRAGPDFGIRRANLGVFGSMRHLVLDFHNYYNGLHGDGYSPDGEAWSPPFEQSNNQFSTRYHGTLANQRLHFAPVLRRTRQLGIPLLVCEWGARLDDRNRGVFNRQMFRLFAANHLSWAEWAIGDQTRFDFP